MSKIFSLIPKVMAEVGAIGKSGYNPHDKYKFRSIDDVYNALQPALYKYGVFFVPVVLDSKEERVQSSSGKDMLRIKLKIRYDVYADDGSKFETVVEGEAIDRGDKATNKAMTAAFKYMLIQVFCIAIEGQEDADKESHEVVSKIAKPDLVSETIEYNPHDYMITFGKYKGQRLQDLNIYDLNNYVSYIKKQSEESKKEIKGQVLEFMTAANNFLDSRDFRNDLDGALS